jgi:DNA-binding transcriptional MerR regulator
VHMMTIGRFAEATGLTVKALRHYNEIGLLAPAHVDPESGYRYYEAAQVEDAVAIRRLRALELPLEEIRSLLRADADGLRSGLAAHGYHVAAETHDKQLLLIELAAIVEGGGASVELEVVDEPTLRLAATIRQLPQHEVGDGIQSMCRRVLEHLRTLGVEPAGEPTALFRGGDRKDWHLVEAGWPVGDAFAGDDEVAVQVYGASPAVRYDYRGPLDELHPAAQRFIATVLGQGHRISQPIRIVFLGDDHARLVWPVAT